MSHGAKASNKLQQKARSGRCLCGSHLEKVPSETHNRTCHLWYHFMHHIFPHVHPKPAAYELSNNMIGIKEKKDHSIVFPTYQ